MSRITYYTDPNNKPAGFSPGVRVGNLVFISGQVSLDSDGALVGEGDCKEQAKQCFQNIESIVTCSGGSLDDIVKITSFMVNSRDYPDYAKVRQNLFPNDGPASSTVFINGLVDKRFLIEIEAIANID